MAEGGGGRGADARLDGRLEFFGARRVVGCGLADAGLQNTHLAPNASLWDRHTSFPPRRLGLQLIVGSIGKGLVQYEVHWLVYRS